MCYMLQNAVSLGTVTPTHVALHFLNATIFYTRGTPLSYCQVNGCFVSATRVAVHNQTYFLMSELLLASKTLFNGFVKCFLIDFF